MTIFRIRLFIYIITAGTAFLSCKKKRADLINGDVDSCPLVTIADENSGVIRDFEYARNNLMRIYYLDSPKATFEFRYDDLDRVENMVVTHENELATYNINFVYDAKGYLSETNTSVAGIPIIRNVFTIRDDRIIRVDTHVSLFGKTVIGSTRIDYGGSNVTKVYTGIDGGPEILAFTGDNYDNRPQFMPKTFKVIALGFVGLNNHFFNYLSTNNLTSGRIYNEKGELDQAITTFYEYDRNGVPRFSESRIEKNGKTTTHRLRYQFLCN
jgi:hypothetical protein